MLHLQHLSIVHPRLPCLSVLATNNAEHSCECGAACQLVRATWSLIYMAPGDHRGRQNVFFWKGSGDGSDRLPVLVTAACNGMHPQQSKLFIFTRRMHLSHC